jgi:hypothetical protein
MNSKPRIIPVYTTSGDLGAYLVYPYLYNANGEWIGWVMETREVYSVLGHYVGWLSDDPRVLRKRAYNYSNPRIEPPPSQPRISVPVTVPLPPMMSELTYSTVDVLEEEPERLSTVDSDDLREDMD